MYICIAYCHRVCPKRNFWNAACLFTIRCRANRNLSSCPNLLFQTNKTLYSIHSNSSVHYVPAICVLFHFRHTLVLFYLLITGFLKLPVLCTFPITDFVQVSQCCISNSNYLLDLITLTILCKDGYFVYFCPKFILINTYHPQVHLSNVYFCLCTGLGTKFYIDIERYRILTVLSYCLNPLNMEAQTVLFKDPVRTVQ